MQRSARSKPLRSRSMDIYLEQARGFRYLSAGRARTRKRTPAGTSSSLRNPWCPGQPVARSSRSIRKLFGDQPPRQKKAAGKLSTAAFKNLLSFRLFYDVTSHQFLFRSEKINDTRPFSLSSQTSAIPFCLPVVENSLCASATSSADASFNVKRFTGERKSR